jgi:SAM-dependent methyltransferase
MAEPAVDAEALFDEDYLHLFAGLLEERAEVETDLIWRLLELQPGLRVLDLACGHGRIANRLAARGCRVTGVDSSRVFLDRARQDATTLGVSVDYVLGDMREPPAGQFDRIVSWFTAFGYFDDPGNRRVLAGAVRALRPGGRLLLDLNNLVAVLRTYQSTTALDAGADLVVDRHRMDPLTGRNLVERTIVRDGRARRVPYFVRMFSYPELRDWLLEAGFAAVTGYGEDGEPLSAEHRRMMVVARL